MEIQKFSVSMKSLSNWLINLSLFCLTND